MEWLDKIFDKFLYWLENMQWNRDKRRQEVAEKKKAKRRILHKKEIEKAKRLLMGNGYTFDRDWKDITYKGERYTPTMVEEISDDIIIIHAKKSFYI